MHDMHRQIFVRYVLEDSGFEGVRKRAVANIVQQYSRQRSFALFIRNLIIFAVQRLQGIIHEVHGPYGVVKTRMQGARINKIG